MVRRKISIGYGSLHAYMEGAWIAPDAKRPRRSYPGAVAFIAGALVVAVLVALVLVFAAAVAVFVLAVVIPVIVAPVLIVALVVFVAIAITAPTAVIRPIVVSAVVVPTVVVGAIVSNVARADDRHVSVPVTPRALHDNVSVLILGLALVNRPAVPVVADLIPAAPIHLLIGAVVDAANRAGASTTHDDIADAAGPLRVGAVLTAAPSLIAAGSLGVEGRKRRKSRERYANDQKLHKIPRC